MANVDVSLDDIIKKRNLKRFGPGRNAARGGGRQNVVKKVVQTQRKLVKPVRQVQIQDARQRLIQKNRAKFQDARDKLASIAKKTDARKRLERIRIRKMSGRNSVVPGGGERLKLVPRIPANSGILRRTISGRQYVNEPRRGSSRMLRRTVDNEFSQSRQHSLYWRNSSGPLGLSSNSDRLTRTVSGSPPPRLMMVDPVQLSLTNPLALKRSLPYDDYDQYESALRRSREVGITARGSIDYPNQMRSLAPPLKRNVPSPEAAEVASPLQGYKILVENLQATVTQEDIMELFSDVGPLRRARLVRPGSAEVIFVNQTDAAKAVETYHNRQLDGRPMKCTLLSTQPPPPPPASTHAGSSSSMKYPTGGRSSVTPDIATIHKALFNKA